MSSKEILSQDSIRVLLNFAQRFHETAAQFCCKIIDEEQIFPLVCKLHATLEFLGRSEEPTMDLQKLGGRGGPDECRNTPRAQEVQDLVGFTLNAEFMLYELYKQYQISLNPSLAHWVGLCRDSEKYVNKTAEGTFNWGLRERLLDVRATFVRGILDQQGWKLAQITPQQFVQTRLHFNVDLNSFTDALHQQGIYNDGDSAQSDFSPEAPMNPDDLGPESNVIQYEKAQKPSLTLAEVTNLIYQATAEDLPTDIILKLLSSLRRTSEHVVQLPLDVFSKTTMTGLFGICPSLANPLVAIALDNGSGIQRRELLNSLEFLPVSLETLEMMTGLLESKCLNADETRYLVNGFLANSIRAAEDLGGPSSIYENMENKGGSGFTTMKGVSMADREAAGRCIALVCLFVQSLLAKGTVELQDIFYHIQDIGMKFSGYCKEARRLRRTHCPAE